MHSFRSIIRSFFIVNIYILTLLSLSSLSLLSPIFGTDKRVLTRGLINGNEVNFLFDTGMTIPLIVFEKTVKDLDLKLFKDGDNYYTRFKLNVGGIQVEKAFSRILTMPPVENIHGLIGWPAMQGSIWRCDWKNMTISPIKSLPSDISSWKRLKIDPESKCATVFLDEASTIKAGVLVSYPEGLALSPARWDALLKREPVRNTTLLTGYSPAADGFHFSPLRFYNKFTIGALTLSHIFVSRSNYKRYKVDTLFGLEALLHYEVIFALMKRSPAIYLKQRSYKSSLGKYNRLGATFPPQSLDSERLIAHVLDGSPAYKAGVRNGDRLLRVNEIDMTQWKQNPEIMKHGFWYEKAGTSYILELDRMGVILKLPVVLEEILTLESK